MFESLLAYYITRFAEPTPVRMTKKIPRKIITFWMQLKMALTKKLVASKILRKWSTLNHKQRIAILKDMLKNYSLSLLSAMLTVKPARVVADNIIMIMGATISLIFQKSLMYSPKDMSVNYLNSM